MKITGIILAGGQGRRMGGVNKGLVEFKGRPMVDHAIERLKPQVDELLINANQNVEEYKRLGHTVISDSVQGFAGPLAGLQSGMLAAHHELVATAPCDSPFLPRDMIARLKNDLMAADAQLAVAVTGSQAQPVFCLCKKDLLPHLTAFLENGGRKIDAWYASLKVAEVDFSDEAEAFMNINTRQELEQAE